MAYQPHTKVSFGGGLGGGGGQDEIWNCNVNVTSIEGGPLGNDQVAYMAEIAVNLGNWFHGAPYGMSTSATLQYVKVNDIAASGLYADAGNTNRYDYSPYVLGGAAALQAPILGLCFSWTTAKGRGPGHRGRIFPPNFTYGTAGQMDVGVNDTGGAASSGKVLLSLLANPNGTIHAVPVVSSKVNATNTVITGVAVGNILDVQRRRKNALIETYSSLVFP